MSKSDGDLDHTTDPSYWISNAPTNSRSSEFGFGSDVVKSALLSHAVQEQAVAFDPSVRLQAATALAIKMGNLVSFLLRKRHNFTRVERYPQYILSIFARYNQLIHALNDCFQRFDLAKAQQAFRSFLYEDLCGGFLEECKVVIKSHDSTQLEKDTAFTALSEVVGRAVGLLYLFMPVLSLVNWVSYTRVGIARAAVGPEKWRLGSVHDFISIVAFAPFDQF